MAKIENIDEKRDGDRLAAHLALAVNQEAKKPEGCLSADQLADMAAHLCTPEERKAAIAHFAECRDCYDEWIAVSLSLVAMDEGSRGWQRPALTIRRLGYIGSALAIAASVVVFINIYRDQSALLMTEPPARLEQVQQAEPQGERLQKSKVGGGASPEELAEEKKEAVHSPAPVVRKQMSMPKSAAPEVMSRESEQFTAADQSDRAAPADNDLADMAADPLTAWFARVEQGCRDRQLSAQGWRELGDAGMKLIAGSRYNPAQLRTLAELVGNQGSGEQCGRIMTFLAEIKKSE